MTVTRHKTVPSVICLGQRSKPLAEAFNKFKEVIAGCDYLNSRMGNKRLKPLLHPSLWLINGLRSWCGSWGGETPQLPNLLTVLDQGEFLETVHII